LAYDLNTQLSKHVNTRRKSGCNFSLRVDLDAFGTFGNFDIYQRY
jgi:hypothetical protein